MLARRSEHKLSYWLVRNDSYTMRAWMWNLLPSPAPWMFADRMYGLGNCLIDRDGRVIGANLPVGNGPLIAQAPAMAALLRELVAGASSDDLRERAARILGRIDQPRPREPGEDDE